MPRKTDIPDKLRRLRAFYHEHNRMPGYTEMLDVFETLSNLYDQADKLSTTRLVQIAKSGEVVSRILNIGSGS